jgi:cyclopropane fatty-acyl-phospholipid synthase-like methyltransferase
MVAVRDIGEVQFEFLLTNGLFSDMKFLDIGCGRFRTGRYLIPFLDDGNYYAIDRKDYSYMLQKEQKSFTFKQTEDFELFDEMFDMIFAWSVFTHLEDWQISWCLGRVEKVMKEDSKFFSTYFPPRGKPDGKQSFGRILDTNNFVYPLEFFEDQAGCFRLNVEEVEVNHHNENQRMLLWTK